MLMAISIAILSTIIIAIILVIIAREALYIKLVLRVVVVARGTLTITIVPCDNFYGLCRSREPYRPSSCAPRPQSLLSLVSVEGGRRASLLRRRSPGARIVA